MNGHRFYTFWFYNWNRLAAFPTYYWERGQLNMRTTELFHKSGLWQQGGLLATWWGPQLCDQIKHTIPTMMDKPVYLPHHTIPRQLQGDVHKCLDTWLHQGIIWPSKSPNASQVVIVCKKLWEMCLCIGYHKLNSILVRDAFPLPQIDVALQAVHSSNWFSSFDLAQGYL